MATSASEEIVQPTAFDTGDGWEGDSGGSGIRGTQNPTVEAPPPQAPAVPAPAPVTDADAGDEDDERGEHQDGTDDQSKPKRRTWAERQAEEKRRVAAIKTERETEARSLQSIREERTRLERELAELRARPAERPTEKAPEKPAEKVAEPLGDEPTWAAYDAEGKDFDTYTKDHAKWVIATARAEAKAAREEAEKATREERERAAQESRHAELETAFEARMDAVRAKYPDLPELAKNLTTSDGQPLVSEFLNVVVFRHAQGAELYNHLVRHPDEARALAAMDFTQPFMTAVRETDDPIALLSYLVTNRGEFDRIARLPPASALVALGRIVAIVRREDASLDASSSPAARVTHAAPPLRQVAGRQSTGGPGADDEKHPDEWTQADVDRMRTQARTVRRR